MPLCELHAAGNVQDCALSRYTSQMKVFAELQKCIILKRKENIFKSIPVSRLRFITTGGEVPTQTTQYLFLCCTT